jgi:pimeloyl-ACP methyl ester carboxylesterase
MSGPISGQIAIDDVSLAFTDRGTGRPILFQHGLGGNEAQVAEVFPDDEGFRRLTLDCRGQGASAPDPQNRYAIRQFAEDALRLADSRRIGRFVAGGISMGAAIALHLAVHHPARVTALILARPAWLFAPAPATMAPYAEVAALLETPDGLATFDASETAAMLAREAPANLTSLRGFFTRPDARVTAALLARVAADGPGVTRAEATVIGVPTLVIGHGRDAVHTLAYAETLAATIPGAELARITPKATDAQAHADEFRAALRRFLASL